MGYSVRQAASMVGKSRKTLYAHIKNGILSAGRDSEGNRVIDKSELLRVYGELSETPIDTENRQIDQAKTASEASLSQELEKAKRNNAIMMLNIQNLRKENTLLKQLLNEARQREKDTVKKHEQVMSIFERMLPGAKSSD